MLTQFTFENTAANEVTFFVLLPLVLLFASLLLLAARGAAGYLARTFMEKEATIDADGGREMLSYLSGEGAQGTPTRQRSSYLSGEKFGDPERTRVAPAIPPQHLPLP